jgi:hypothetical protein
MAGEIGGGDATRPLVLTRETPVLSTVQRLVRLRPKERAPKSLLAIVVAIDDVRQWFFLPAGRDASLVPQTMP